MSKKKQTKSLKLAVIFFTIFLLLVLASAILKVINVFQRSTFDGRNQFTVSAIGNTKNVSIISLSPNNNSIYILDVKNGKGRNLIKTLQIPIDGEIYTNLLINEKNIKVSSFKFLIPFNIYQTNLTVVDLFRLWIYTNSVLANSIYQQEISIDDDQDTLESLDIYSYFVDQKIAEEKVTVEIINGTQVFGLGNKFASFLSNIGVNVVMVSTSEKIIDKSKIDYFQKENYTLKRISRILNFPIKNKDKKTFGDITIVIGQDALDRIKF